MWHHAPRMSTKDGAQVRRMASMACEESVKCLVRSLVLVVQIPSAPLSADVQAPPKLGARTYAAGHVVVVAIESLMAERVLPNFIFLGTDKSGSTWLHARLSEHPQVFLTPAKDVFYFDNYYDRGLDWYADQFAGAKPQHKVVGEICNTYLYSPEARERIATDLPGVKVMVSLREPLDHAFSHYRYLRRSGLFRGSFREFFDNEPGIMGAARYSEYVGPYIERLGRNRVHVGVFEELQEDPQRFMDGVTDWLGIDRLPLDQRAAAPKLAASSARSQAIARLSKWGADRARDLGMPRLVGRIKLSPVVQRALYRPIKDDAVEEGPTAEDRARVREEFRDEIKRLSDMCDIDFARRWGWD
jgi:hypothetical protein